MLTYTFRDSSSAKIRVENVHYDLTPEDLEVRTAGDDPTMAVELRLV